MAINEPSDTYNKLCGQTLQKPDEHEWCEFFDLLMVGK